jgi:hypothetical protein
VQEIRCKTRRRPEDKIRIVLKEHAQLKQFVAEIVLENRLLNKTFSDSGDDTRGLTAAEIGDLIPPPSWRQGTGGERPHDDMRPAETTFGIPSKAQIP